ncbi:MAG: alpha/beta hydrolase [Proteobacteria bacterium]|nr:alpha/beta hydrolase [Pseudomonadota bacterium]
MATFTSDGFSLAYDDIGPRDGGRPVLLIHGFASNRRENWRRLGWYGAFERKHMRVLALDCRGHGESAKPHDSTAYDRKAMVGDIFALMDYLGVETATLLGFSMGARLALAAAMERPERVKNLIIGGVGAKLFKPTLPGNPMADAMEATDPQAIAEPLLRSFRQFADEQGEDRQALAACARGGWRPFQRAGLREVRVPALVVAGARDELAGDPDELADAFADGRAITLPGCDHFSAIPHALFKASVFDFLDGTME